MTNTRTFGDGVITLSDLVAAAEEAGEAPPTVETFLRRIAYPSPTAPLSGYIPSSHDPLLDGHERSARQHTVFGLCYFPDLASILSEHGLAYLLSQSLHSPATPLNTILPNLSADELPRTRPLSHMSSISCLRTGLQRVCPALIPPDASRRLGLALFSWECLCGRNGQASHSCGISPVQLNWHENHADDVLELLDELATVHSAGGSSWLAWQHRPRLEATNPWTRLDTLVQKDKDCRPLLVNVLGEMHFTPLFVLDIDPSRLPSSVASDRSPQLSDLIEDSHEAEAVLARLASPRKPKEWEKDIVRGSSPLLVVFGPKLPINASLQSDGASLIHAIYAAGSKQVEATIQEQVAPLLGSDKPALSPDKLGLSDAAELSTEDESGTPCPPVKQEYRLVTFDELKKIAETPADLGALPYVRQNEPFYAAFVCPDGTLATLHSFSPLPPASRSPAPAAEAVPTPSSDHCSPASGPPIAQPSPLAPKPILLLASGEMGQGNQGYIYRAHCADSPFPLIAKYSRRGSSSNTKVADEAKFYRKHGDKLVEEELAPRFVGAWVAEEGEASPYKMGGATTLLLMEEWGTSVSGWCHLSRAERNAVRELAVRFHLKLEAYHGSLKADNVVWKRDVGASSFRLIDFARSNDEDCMCRTEYPCCEELITLAESLAWSDMVEMVEAGRERLKLAEALAVVGAEEHRLCEQARMEEQLQVQ